MDLNLDGPSADVVAIAKRAISMKAGDQLSVAEVKLISQAVLQFELATKNLEEFCAQMNAAANRQNESP